MRFLFDNVQNKISSLLDVDISQLKNLHLELHPNYADDDHHTLIMYGKDIDKEPYIYLLVINILGNDIENGDTILPYEEPHVRHYTSPRKKSQEYELIVEFYRQPEVISVNVPTTRSHFNLENFVRDNDLHLLDQGILNISKMRTRGQNTLVFKHNHNDYFLPDSTLNDQEKKYCRCVLNVASQQPGACNLEKAWFERREGSVCYNPYAVCASSVGTSSRECGDNYNFQGLPLDHVKAYAGLHGIQYTEYTSRDVLINDILKWKSFH